MIQYPPAATLGTGRARRAARAALRAPLAPPLRRAGRHPRPGDRAPLDHLAPRLLRGVHLLRDHLPSGPHRPVAQRGVGAGRKCAWSPRSRSSAAPSPTSAGRRRTCTPRTASAGTATRPARTVVAWCRTSARTSSWATTTASSLYRKAAKVPGVKHVFLGSGLRHDLLAGPAADAYLRQICAHQVSGLLKVAPEHCDDGVLRLMNKPRFAVYEEFVKRFKAAAKSVGKEIYIVNYFITSHPGRVVAREPEARAVPRQAAHQARADPGLHPGAGHPGHLHVPHRPRPLDRQAGARGAQREGTPPAAGDGPVRPAAQPRAPGRGAHRAGQPARAAEVRAGVATATARPATADGIRRLPAKPANRSEVVADEPRIPDPSCSAPCCWTTCSRCGRKLAAEPHDAAPRPLARARTRRAGRSRRHAPAAAAVAGRATRRGRALRDAGALRRDRGPDHRAHPGAVADAAAGGRRPLGAAARAAAGDRSSSGCSCASVTTAPGCRACPSRAPTPMKVWSALRARCDGDHGSRGALPVGRRAAVVRGAAGATGPGQRLDDGPDAAVPGPAVVPVAAVAADEPARARREDRARAEADEVHGRPGGRRAAGRRRPGHLRAEVLPRGVDRGAGPRQPGHRPRVAAEPGALRVGLLRRRRRQEPADRRRHGGPRRGLRHRHPGGARWRTCGDGPSARASTRSAPTPGTASRCRISAPPSPSAGASTACWSTRPARAAAPGAAIRTAGCAPLASELPDLRAHQLRLLRLAADGVRPGGRLVYATCSWLCEENEDVVGSLLAERGDLALISQADARQPARRRRHHVHRRVRKHPSEGPDRGPDLRRPRRA